MKAALCPNCQSLHTVEGIIFDERRGTISWPGGSVRLTSSEYRVVDAILRLHAVSIDHLIAAVYETRDEPDGAENTIKVFIVKIRRRLAAVGFPGEVKTIWGRGYEIILHKPDKAAA